MRRGVEEGKRPLAAGGSFTLGASPPGHVLLLVGGTSGRTGNVPEYLQQQDGGAFTCADLLFVVFIPKSSFSPFSLQAVLSVVDHICIFFILKGQCCGLIRDS